MKKNLIITLLVTVVVGATYAQGPGFTVKGGPPPDVKPVEGQPLETREANGANQKPAFAGQTRIGASITKATYKATVITDKLFRPWSIAFMPNGKMLISEKRGSLRIVSQDGVVSDTLTGMPKVLFGVDAGLLDLEIDPNFKSNRSFYFTYVERGKRGSVLVVGSAQLAADEKSIENRKVIFRLKDEYPVPAHIGSRLLFNKEGKLFVSTGERFLDNVRVQAQWLRSDLGKILRINTDGTPATGNPNFPDSANARKECLVLK